MNDTELNSEGSEAAVLARANFERVVGEVLLFLSSIPPYDELFLEEIGDRIIRPLALKQYEIVRSKDGLILGYTSWAFVTDELAERLEAGEVVRLDREDWNCGERVIIVDKVGAVKNKDIG